MSVSTHHPDVSVPGRLEEVADGVFAYIQGVPHNTGLWQDIEYGELRLALPFLTFADRLTLWADELRCELIYAGQAAGTAAQRGGPVNGPGALADMVTYNGGRPLTCLA